MKTFFTSLFPFRALRFGVLLFFCVFHSLFSFAQNPHDQVKRANIWYFGTMIANGTMCAGLDFSSGSPVPLTNGFGGAIEGPSSISDTSGNHLFHSNCAIIIDNSQDTMLNGDTLMTTNSTAQGILMVPLPGSQNLVYLFTVDEGASGGPRGLRYSLIDMNLNGGLGAVVQGKKNVLLRAPSTEQLNAVHHCNGRDIWVMTSELFGNHFFAFKVTDQGVDTVPVISSANIIIPANAAGSLKFSPNGRHCGITVADFVLSPQLFRFNNATGIVSNAIPLQKDTAEYGLSFSPDSKKLYIGTQGAPVPAKLIQYDLSSEDSATIVNSRTLIYADYDRSFGSVQLGPDGKIYFGGRYDTMAVINSPNSPGLACDFVPLAFSLNGGQTSYGQGSFIESYFNTDTTAFQCGVGIGENNYPSMLLNLFPNPCLYHVQAILQGVNPAVKPIMELYDASGKNVTGLIHIENHEKFNERQIFSLDCSNLTSGNYMVFFKTARQKLSKILIVNSKNQIK